MTRSSVYAAIDVGTTKIVTLVGEAGADGDLRILGIGVAPSRGLKRGVVVDVEEAVEAIRLSVERAERSSGYKIESAQVGLAGSHVTSINNKGIVAVASSERVVEDGDLHRAIETAQSVSIPNNREVIHVIPRTYTVDGQAGVRNPVGLHGFRLEVETHIITGASSAVQNLRSCVERAGIIVDGLVLEPIASSEAILTEEEKEMGVVLADIGGGTTDIAVYIDGSIWHTAILPVGGWHLTNDIAIALRTPFATAEEIKAQYGQARAQAISPDDEIEIATFGAESSRLVSRRLLCDVIQERVVEILEMIYTEVSRSGYDGLLAAGLVLAGGCANLRGLEDLAREVVPLPMRVGYPAGVQGLTDTIYDPAYATSVGLLLWGCRYEQPRSRTRRRPGAGGLADAYRRILGWARQFVPAQ